MYPFLFICCLIFTRIVSFFNSKQIFVERFVMVIVAAVEFNSENRDKKFFENRDRLILDSLD